MAELIFVDTVNVNGTVYFLKGGDPTTYKMQPPSSPIKATAVLNFDSGSGYDTRFKATYTLTAEVLEMNDWLYHVRFSGALSEVINQWKFRWTFYKTMGETPYQNFHVAFNKPAGSTTDYNSSFNFGRTITTQTTGIKFTSGDTALRNVLNTALSLTAKLNMDCSFTGGQDTYGYQHNLSKLICNVLSSTLLYPEVSTTNLPIPSMNIGTPGTPENSSSSSDQIKSAPVTVDSPKEYYFKRGG